MPTSRDAIRVMALIRRQPRDVQFEIYPFLEKKFGHKSNRKRRWCCGRHAHFCAAYRCMAAIRGKDTRPEQIVRMIAHRRGCRFRLHAADLPGKPDLVFRSRRALVFVHGCFWHSHACRRGLSTARTNAAFWRLKRRRNRERDKRTLAALRRAGWRVLVIWECHTRNPERLARRLQEFLGEARP